MAGVVLYNKNQQSIYKNSDFKCFDAVGWVVTKIGK